MDSEGVHINLESNTISLDDKVDDDDVLEIEDEGVEVVEKPVSSKEKGKRKRKLTSPVWGYFDRLSVKATDGATRCKCKLCNSIFKCDSRYGTGNLQRHIKNYPCRNTRDIGQLIVGADMKLKSLKFDAEKFRQLLVAAIVMHNLPLSFIEYRGVRALFSYLYPEVTLISRNTLKDDLMKMYKLDKK